MIVDCQAMRARKFELYWAHLPLIPPCSLFMFAFSAHIAGDTTKSANPGSHVDMEFMNISSPSVSIHTNRGSGVVVRYFACRCFTEMRHHKLFFTTQLFSLWLVKLIAHPKLYFDRRYRDWSLPFETRNLCLSKRT
jgi:hypothetical protein